MTDKKKLQERFRKTLKKAQDAETLEIDNVSNPQPNEEHATSFEHEKATRFDAVPKRRIDDRQNYKKNDHKAKPKKKFSTDGRYLQKQHSIKIKPQKSSKEAKLKRHLKNETQKVDQRSSNYKSSTSGIDKDKSKTHLRSEKNKTHKKNMLHKQNKPRAHEWKGYTKVNSFIKELFGRSIVFWTLIYAKLRINQFKLIWSQIIQRGMHPSIVVIITYIT